MQSFHFILIQQALKEHMQEPMPVTFSVLQHRGLKTPLPGTTSLLRLTAGQVLIPTSITNTQNYIDINVTAFIMDMVANPASNYGFMLSS